MVFNCTKLLKLFDFMRINFRERSAKGKIISKLKFGFRIFSSFEASFQVAYVRRLNLRVD